VVSRVSANVVRVGDVFEFEEGTSPRLLHIRQDAPIKDDGKVDLDWRPGDVREAYAVAYFTDHSTLPTRMQRWEIDRIRDMSQGYKSAIQYKKTDNPWMARRDGQEDRHSKDI
jgi:hypothetical protein